MALLLALNKSYFIEREREREKKFANKMQRKVFFPLESLVFLAFRYVYKFINCCWKLIQNPHKSENELSFPTKEKDFFCEVMKNFSLVPSSSFFICNLQWFSFSANFPTSALEFSSWEFFPSVRFRRSMECEFFFNIFCYILGKCPLL